MTDFLKGFAREVRAEPDSQTREALFNAFRFAIKSESDARAQSLTGIYKNVGPSIAAKQQMQEYVLLRTLYYVSESRTAEAFDEVTAYAAQQMQDNSPPTSPTQPSPPLFRHTIAMSYQKATRDLRALLIAADKTDGAVTRRDVLRNFAGMMAAVPTFHVGMIWQSSSTLDKKINDSAKTSRTIATSALLAGTAYYATILAPEVMEHLLQRPEIRIALGHHRTESMNVLRYIASIGQAIESHEKGQDR